MEEMDQNRNSRTFILTDDFEEFATESEIFIDKSMFIQDFVTTLRSYWIVARPRKWGKTLNLDMCRRFLEMEIDENGTATIPDPENKKLTSAYKLFTEALPKSGKKLAIAAKEEFIKKNLGRHPLIFLSFKNAKGGNFHEMKKKVLDILAPLFEKHQYLLNKLDKSGFQYREFNAIMKKTVEDEYIIGGSLLLLTKLLHMHFGMKVYVILDDYDKLFIKMFLDWKDEDEIEKGKLIFGGMISQLNNNPPQHIHKILCASNLNLESMLDFSASCAHLLENKFLEWFGLTQADTKWAMQEFGLISKPQNDEEMCTLEQHQVANLDQSISCLATDSEIRVEKEMVEWFGGYYVPTFKIYLASPNSFFQQLTDFDANIRREIDFDTALRADSWWQNEDIIHSKIQKCLAKSNELRKIVHQIVHEELHLPTDLNKVKFTDDDFNKLRKAATADDKNEQNQKVYIGFSTVAKFLYALGYITIHSVKSPTKNTMDVYRTKVANMEAQKELNKLIYNVNKDIFHWDENAEQMLDNALFGLLQECEHDQMSSCNLEALKNAMIKFIFPMRFVDIINDDDGFHENEYIFQNIVSYRAMVVAFKNRDRRTKFGGEVGAKKEGGREIIDEDDDWSGTRKKGQTRADIVFSMNKIAVIIETKNDRTHFPNKESGMKLAEEGLQQIYERQYQNIFTNDSRISVLKSVGISAGCSRGGDVKFICIAAKCSRRSALENDSIIVKNQALSTFNEPVGRITRSRTMNMRKRKLGNGNGGPSSTENPQVGVNNIQQISNAVGKIKNGQILKNIEE